MTDKTRGGGTLSYANKLANAPASVNTSNGTTAKSKPSESNIVRNDYVDGFMFVCNKDTYQECLDQALFGLPFHYLKEVKTLQAGLSALFLFNKSERRLHGIFEATTNGGANLKPEAWNPNGAKSSPFPAQIEFRVVKRGSISESEFKHLFRDRQRIRKLTGDQVKNLIRLFPTENGSRNKMGKNVKSSKPLSKTGAWGSAGGDKGLKEQKEKEVEENKPKAPAFAWAVPPPKFSWGAKPAVVAAEKKTPELNSGLVGGEEQKKQDVGDVGAGNAVDLQQQDQPQIQPQVQSQQQANGLGSSEWGAQAVSDNMGEIGDVVPPPGAAPMYNEAPGAKKEGSTGWSYSDMLKRNDPNVSQQQDNLEGGMQNLSVGEDNDAEGDAVLNVNASGGIDDVNKNTPLNLDDAYAPSVGVNIPTGNVNGLGMQYNIPPSSTEQQNVNAYNPPPNLGQNSFDPFGNMDMNGNMFNAGPDPYNNISGPSFNQFGVGSMSNFNGNQFQPAQQNLQYDYQVPAQDGPVSAPAGNRRAPPGLELQQPSPSPESSQYYDRHPQYQQQNTFSQQQYQQVMPPPMQTSFDAGFGQFGLGSNLSSGLGGFPGNENNGSWDVQQQPPQPLQQQQQNESGQFGGFSGYGEVSNGQAPPGFGVQYENNNLNAMGNASENKENNNSDNQWGQLQGGEQDNQFNEDDVEDDDDSDLHAVCNGSQQCMCISCCPELPASMTLAELFIRVGMEKELEIFEQEEVDFQSLMMMSKNHLKDLGLTLGSRMKLIYIIRQLRRRVIM